MDCTKATNPGKSLPSPVTAGPRWLPHLARGEVIINRDQLHVLYERGAELTGDARYRFLWLLSQLEQVCAALERCALQAMTDQNESFLIRQKIAARSLRSVELRQKALLLLNTCELAAKMRAQRQSFAERQSHANVAAVA